MALFRCQSGNGGGSAEIATVLRPSSVSASSSHASGNYNADKAVNMNFSSTGWLPVASSTTANITFTYNSAQDVKYVLFGLSTSAYDTAINSGDMSVEIQTSSGGAYSSSLTDTFSRVGTGFVYKIYPINKSASSIKVLLDSTGSSYSLTSGTGYKFLAFG